ncbi:MAG TPA: NAD-dependent epimerase/dehydratase family protein [Chitinophagales bacterium]|nr:NAD-dependent epimerase/dehydratase family protein [Chitinophagales bacterium]
MKYFLTGATGFVGGRMARLLRSKNHEVVAIVRTPDKANDLKDIGVTIVKGDVTDKESMRKPMMGCDGVFHIAGWYKIGVRDKTPGQKVNIDGTRNVLELMKELHIPKGVYTSTLAVNSDTHGQLYDETFHFTGKHLSEYDRTKAAAHHIANKFIQQGLPLIIVMPGLIYGPGDTSMSGDSIRDYLRKKLPMLPKKSAYCWAHVDDIVMAHWLAMEKGKSGETYIICGPPHTLTEAYQLAEKITGIPAPRFVSPTMMSVSAAFAAVIEKVFPLPELYSSESLRVIAGHTYLGNNSKAKQELGYNPRDLESGLRETLTYEMKELGIRKEL